MRLSPSCLLLSIFMAGQSFANPAIPDAARYWQEYKPGGGTICARGEEFAFFVAKGSTDKIVIDFIGGGACWNAETCDIGGPFTDSIDGLRQRAIRGELEGVYDRSNPNNPFKDWTHVVVPYCTGDIHWGDNTVTYQKTNGTTFTIHHRGARNAKAVLNWLQEHYQNPENVLVTGCSAGSYGSIYWTPHIRQMYPSAHLKQLGDSGVGIITKEFFDQSFPNWNTTSYAPKWIPSLNPDLIDWKNLTLEELYVRLANHYPEVNLSQFNSAYDDIQTFYYELMGGLATSWNGKLLQSLNYVEQKVPNFKYYVAPGSEHCVIPYNYYYTQTSNNVSFRNWFENYINDQLVENVVCSECDPENVGN